MEAREKQGWGSGALQVGERMPPLSPSPSPSPPPHKVPLPTSQVASPWGGTQHQASWTLLRSLLVPTLLTHAGGCGGVGRLFLAPQFTFYLHTSSLCLPTLGSLTICPQFSPIFPLELCGSFYSIEATLPVPWLASKLCKHDHTGTALVTSVHTASGSAHSR